MAEIIWTEPALAQLDEIADYIALDNPVAASDLVARVFEHVAQLTHHPYSAPRLPEWPDSRYRQLIEPPCRVIYRIERGDVLVVYIARAERRLLVDRLQDAD